MAPARIGQAIQPRLRTKRALRRKYRDIRDLCLAPCDRTRLRLPRQGGDALGKGAKRHHKQQDGTKTPEHRRRMPNARPSRKHSETVRRSPKAALRPDAQDDADCAQHDRLCPVTRRECVEPGQLRPDGPQFARWMAAQSGTGSCPCRAAVLEPAATLLEG